MNYIDTINKNDTNYTLCGTNDIIFCYTSSDNSDKTIDLSDFPQGTEDLTKLIFKIKFVYGNVCQEPYLRIQRSDSSYLYDDELIIMGDYNLSKDVIYECYYDGTYFNISNYENIETTDTSSVGNLTNSNALHNQSTTYMMNYISEYQFDYTEKTINISGKEYYDDTPFDFIQRPFNGAIINIFNKDAIMFNSTINFEITLYLQFNEDSLSKKPIKCVRNGQLENLRVFYGDFYRQNNYKYGLWGADTYMSLIYSSTNSCWIIMNNPIFYESLSPNFKNYRIYSNGFLEQWGNSNQTSTNQTVDLLIYFNESANMNLTSIIQGKTTNSHQLNFHNYNKNIYYYVCGF